ncbi:MAG: type II toxin-antitoxin system RelE/ParE family toxin [Elusimicrobia bacterium]|nr:type II toxin-antitoxin system RelE/ParE family toxin [Elusimicrobiota bacterium]
MSIVILSVAEDELREAVAYYNAQGPGLGFEFAAEVKAAFGRISAFPDAWPEFSARTRRCIVNRFPYGVLYQHTGDAILVIAIMHLSRSPQRWQDRAA